MSVVGLVSISSLGKFIIIEPDELKNHKWA